MITISRDYYFSAAHILPNHKGKCARLHGHNYRLVVTVRASSLADKGSEEGMVIDFGNLDLIVKPIVAQLDHRFLARGDEWPFSGRPLSDDCCYVGVRTTAENLAAWLGRWIGKELEPPVYLYKITLWETDRNCATWTP